MSEQPVLSVSDFVAVLNLTLEYAYPKVTIMGELANFKVSKGRWVYFDLKDEQASVRFFGTVYNLPGPLKDGMKLQVSGTPRLHSQFGFSVGVQHIQLVGEGSIKKAAELLKAKLQAEGLFNSERKRQLPYPPTKIGLVASSESAAYADFIKIINNRWHGVDILLANVQVQGEVAPQQISEAIEKLNTSGDLDVIVVTRGGGSTDDLQTFSTEKVVRAIAGSRTPTLVAIGHEIDLSLAELAADMSASTPSNAAELLVPDQKDVLRELTTNLETSGRQLTSYIERLQQTLVSQLTTTEGHTFRTIESQQKEVYLLTQLAQGYDPKRILRRGYAWIRSGDTVITSVKQLERGSKMTARFVDGLAMTTVDSVKRYTSK